MKEERTIKMRKIPILLLVIFCTSCGMFKPSYDDIPLTESSVPYVLPPGQYKDTHGVIHNESSVRWSLSPADLFRYSKPEVINDPPIISIDKPVKPVINKPSLTYLIIGGSLATLFLIFILDKVLRKSKSGVS